MISCQKRIDFPESVWPYKCLKIYLSYKSIICPYNSFIQCPVSFRLFLPLPADPHFFYFYRYIFRNTVSLFPIYFISYSLCVCDHKHIKNIIYRFSYFRKIDSCWRHLLVHFCNFFFTKNGIASRTFHANFQEILTNSLFYRCTLWVF